MRNKLFLLFLFIFACVPAWADVVYTYTDSNGVGHVGFINVIKTEGDDNNFAFVVSRDIVTDRNFNNKIQASVYRRNNRSYAIITEPPSEPNKTVNSNDTAFIYNYNTESSWTLANSFDMVGALNVRNVAASSNGNSLFAAAYGFDDETLNSGIIEYSASNFRPTGNSYVFSDDVEDCIVHAEALVIDNNYIYSLFSVRSEDKWIESNLSVLDGQLLWKTRYISELLNPHAVDFALARNDYVLAACMGEGNVSSEVSLLQSRNFVTLVSADNSGNLIGEVLSVGRDSGSGAYFIALNNNQETLYHCADINDGTLDADTIDVTPSLNSDLISSNRKILWDNDNKLVFAMGGDKIIIIDNENNVLNTFSASELGGYPSSISVIKESSSKSKSNNNDDGCNTAYFGLIALIIPAFFVKKLKNIFKIYRFKKEAD